MFVKVSREIDLIRLPAQFARIVDVLDNNDIIIEVKHSVKQSDIVKRNAKLVRVSVVTKTMTPLSILQLPGQSKPSTDQVVRNILNQIPTLRSNIRNFESAVVAKKMTDNMSKLDFELIGALQKNDNPKNVAALYKPQVMLRSVADLNTQNDIKPILQVNRTSVSSNAVPIKQLAQNAILRHGFDPSFVANIVDEEVLTPREAVSGMFLKSTRLNVNESSSKYYKEITSPQKIIPANTSNIPYETNVLSMETVFVDDVIVKTKLVLPYDKLKDSSGNFKQTFIAFDLLNEGGICVQTIQESIDVLKYLEAFYTPRKAPIVKFARFETSGKANIQIKQQDKRAVSVKIYRKDFSYVNNDPTTYQLVTQHEIPCDGSFETIPIDVSPSFTNIFRVVSVGKNDAMSPEFTNIVVNPTKTIRRRTHVSMTSRIVENGVNIDVSDVPFDVVSIAVLRKDRTVRGKFEFIGDEIVQVTPENQTVVYTITDTTVKKSHVYEYICRLFFKNGSAVDAGVEFVDYQPLVQNFVDTRIENLEVSRAIDNLDVSFKISTVVNETNADSIKSLLEKQGLYDLFEQDVLKERDKLQKLIAHQIHRVDLTDGTKENFGIITGEKFSDSQFRLINAVRPLQLGHAYRYEVSALLRSPETMFEDYVKTSIDESTKKSFSFKPSKFLHPITLRLGNLATPQTLQEHYSQSQLSFGNVGNVVKTEVSFTDNIINIIDASADAFDSGTHLVKWAISGDPQKVDHFLIMKEFLNQRSVVGKCHAVNETTSFRFFYELTSADMGEVEYIIIPVFDNYDVGTEIKTNKVVII